MQAYTQGVARPKATEILSGPPRSGTFSVYSKKLTALAFVWLCAIVVWGNLSNYATILRKCDARCAVTISFAIFVWLNVTLLLVFNYLAEKQSISRHGCFSHGLEVQWIGLLIFLWIPVLVSVSMLPSGTTTALSDTNAEGTISTMDGTRFLDPDIALVGNIRQSGIDVLVAFQGTPVANWFAWLGFLGSWYATYKAYHSFKEEDLPSPLPEGFDEEDYVYG